MSGENKSTLTFDLLSKYATGYGIFVETGTAAGEGVQTALDFGFEKIITYEINESAYVAATKRFIDRPVICVLGDSGEYLSKMLLTVNKPAVFWLDAHWSTGEEPLPPGASRCPVLAELRAIAAHPVKGHLIMIDDIRYFKRGIPQWDNINLGDIVDGIMAIDRNYWITFEPGVTENDILIAKIR